MLDFEKNRDNNSRMAIFSKYVRKTMTLVIENINSSQSKHQPLIIKIQIEYS